MAETENSVPMKNTNNTVQQAWEQYQVNVVPPQASDAQRVETRRAFYGGALSVVNIMITISAEGVSENAGAAIFENVRQECVDYYHQQLAEDLVRIKSQREGN